MRLRRTFETRLPGGLIFTPQYESPGVRRPSKLAAGMSFTLSRTKHFARINGREFRDVLGPVLFLIVKGTTCDMRGLTWITQKSPCPCCGSKTGGKLRLNDGGRRRLKTLRHMRARRLAKRG